VGEGQDESDRRLGNPRRVNPLHVGEDHGAFDQLGPGDVFLHARRPGLNPAQLLGGGEVLAREVREDDVRVGRFAVELLEAPALFQVEAG
jgi:hypothetical protein